MINCYILDDEPHAVDTLVKYVKKVPELNLIGYSSDPIDGLKQIKAAELDLVFLDIDMPELSGIEMAQLLSPHVLKIFVTAFSNYALKAFEVNAIDYLLKPVAFSQFLKCVEKIQHFIEQTGRQETNNPNESIFINPGVRGKVLQIHVDEILYVEGLKNYIILFTANGGKHITYLTMNEIYSALPRSKFVRIHKSFIVNIKKIQSVEGNVVKLVEHLALPIGPNYKSDFMDVITTLTVKTNRK